ncbi:MAG: hypothetical protein MUC97_02410 [Bernardetiaceae bacterium]|jgi:hypothetical protein|nr:hypothetical protein [Bernardetiaceae bacterium]
MAQTDQPLALNLGLSAPNNPLALVWQRLATPWQVTEPVVAPVEDPTAPLRASVAHLEQSLAAAQTEAERLLAENQALRQANLRLRQRHEGAAARSVVAPEVPGLAQIQTWFPGATGLVHRQFNHGSCLVGLENLGIHYLLLIKSPFRGHLGEAFAHFAAQFLQNVVTSHKYIAPGGLLAHLGQWASQLGPMAAPGLQATACLVDQPNGEVELAQQGLPVYAQTELGWQTYPASPGPAERKLHLSPGQRLLLCTQPLATDHPLWPAWSSATQPAPVWPQPAAGPGLAPDFLLAVVPF